ncbi:MAG: hypothetical protein CL833_05980 [Crocinitomicaceae bacterium]|nr:hypothetical protein [Crocinitomicaceae bacterium]
MSEASSNVSSETLVGAALKHPDVHGLFIDQFMKNQRNQRPQHQELEESKTQEPEGPQETFDDREVQELIAREEHEKAIEQQKARELEAQKQYEQELAEYNKKLEEHYEQQKALKLEAQKQYEQELVEYNKQVDYVESVNKAAQDIKEKKAKVFCRSYKLEEKLEKLNKKKHQKSRWEKAKKATKKLNIANTDLHNAINHYNALTGSSERVCPTKIKKPEKPSWDDRLGSRLAAIGFESINVSVGVPLYPTTTPNLTDRNIKEPTPPVLPTPPSINESKPREFSYQDVQKVQEQRILETNMAYKTPTATQPQQTQYSPNIGQWEQGVVRNVQRPPENAWVTIQSGIRPSEHKVPGMKQYPNIDRTQSKIPTWIRNFASGGEPLDPQERINQNTQILVAHTKAAAKTLGSIADELRSFGCINAKFDQGKVTLRFDREISNKIEEMVSQHLPNMDHVKNFRYVEFTAGLANDVVMQAFMMPFFQAQKAKPLLDRVLVRPQGVGRQLQFLKRLNQPVCHSGIGNPLSEMVAVERPLPTKTIEQLKNRSIKQIRTDWVFPKKGGATINGRWYTEHALERMAPRTPEVMAELEVRMLARAEKAGYKPQTEEFGEWLMKNAPNPRNIPPSVIEAEIARPGSTSIRVELNAKGDVVTVIPRR